MKFREKFQNSQVITGIEITNPVENCSGFFFFPPEMGFRQQGSDQAEITAELEPVEETGWDTWKYLVPGYIVLSVSQA